MAFFAARQPILDINKNVYGYELLFRTGSDNVFPDIDQEKATSKMIEGLQFDLGLNKISSGKFAFINFTEESIVKSYPRLLPKDKVVIEILETVNPTDEIYSELKQLHDEGYVIALDDFIHTEQWERFYEICKIIKVDCLNILEDELTQIAHLKKRHPHIVLLAEKVESYDEFTRYVDLGFDLFQGYFFSKPELMTNASMSSSQALLSSLLSEITKAVPDIKLITGALEMDAGLSFKVLRYTQSPLFKRGGKIESIRHAVVMLGKAELERIITLLFAASLGSNKPTELIKLSMHRAKFCEGLATMSHTDDNVSSAFLVGMLSLIDAMLDASIEDLIGNMPLSDSIKEALLTSKGWLGEAVLVCEIIEKGEWIKLDKACAVMKLEYDEVVSAYIDSAIWAEERLDLMI
ncbi:MAG: EAL and modified HD-GYP domain-containing signal transduction protein [Alphaproteobacteria bacterium]|jgi:EAL and modified HD-GYP domain-containing signal transduction protein